MDTWGVDYVLLDKAGELIEMPWNHRDSRTRGMMEKVKERTPPVSHEEIFAESGAQFMEINTLYQLLAANERDPALLASADKFLMIPDWLHFKMCGARTGEFTNATTTQFFHPTKKQWSVELLQKLGLPTAMLPEVVQPGTGLGALLPALRERTGLHTGVKVIAPATHDTGSAVAGVPGASEGRSAYISSGTWSLLGVELPGPDLSQRAFEHNFTNEGGVDGTYRLLKNIMGLWLVQECRRSFAKGGSASDYAALVLAAEGAQAFRSLVNPDDTVFLNPPDMPEAIAQFCRETNQPVPGTEGDFVRCALESLALRYTTVLRWLQEMTGSAIGAVNIVGGGSRNRLLNQFTANACKCPVFAGPVEATVLGNVLVQARACGELGSLADIRRVARESSEVEEILPEHDNSWSEALQRYATMNSRRSVFGSRT